MAKCARGQPAIYYDYVQSKGLLREVFASLAADADSAALDVVNKTKLPSDFSGNVNRVGAGAHTVLDLPLRPPDVGHPQITGCDSTTDGKYKLSPYRLARTGSNGLVVKDREPQISELETVNVRHID